MSVSDSWRAKEGFSKVNGPNYSYKESFDGGGFNEG